MTDVEQDRYPLTHEQMQRAMQRGRLERSQAFWRVVDRLFGRRHTKPASEPSAARTIASCG